MPKYELTVAIRRSASRNGQAVRPERDRVGDNVRQKARARLEPINFIEIVIGPNCRKMYDLVETVPEPRCLCVEEDEAHLPAST
jgi:hypothetical protein